MSFGWNNKGGHRLTPLRGGKPWIDSKSRILVQGRRGAGTYLPIISKLTDDLELVAVCDPREESVTEQGEKYNVPAYTDTEQMLDTAKPDICAIVITPSNNHIPGLALF